MARLSGGPRLVIGIEASGKDQLDALATSVGKVEKSVEKFQATLSQTSKGSMDQAVAAKELTASFLTMEASAKRAEASLKALFSASGSSIRNDVMATAKAVDLLAAAHNNYISALAKEKSLGDADVQSFNRKTAAINAQIAAFNKLNASAGGGMLYKSGVNYSGQFDQSKV